MRAPLVCRFLNGVKIFLRPLHSLTLADCQAESQEGNRSKERAACSRKGNAIRQRRAEGRILPSAAAPRQQHSDSQSSQDLLCLRSAKPFRSSPRSWIWSWSFSELVLTCVTLAKYLWTERLSCELWAATKSLKGVWATLAQGGGENRPSKASSAVQAPISSVFLPSHPLFFCSRFVVQILIEFTFT